MPSEIPFFKAVKWAYAGNWGEKGFSALFLFVLAGVLGPQDFGIVAIGVVYVNFLQMLLDQGFMAALIQKKDLEPDHVNSVFWMNVVLSLLFTVTSYILSGWWAAKNHAPEAAKFILVLSICIPIQGLASVQCAILNRAMNFKALSIRTNLAVILSGVVGIGMALAGFRIWALVGQQVVRDVVALVLLWRFSEWRPRLSFSFRHLKDLAKFSMANLAAQLAVFADGQAISIFLGLLFGPVAVGLYRLADRLVNTVVSIATSSIQGVALPEFARLQDRPDEIRNSALTCIWLSATVTLPALGGMAAVSPVLMATLGAQWVPATHALQILCVVGVSVVFASFTGPLFQALSRPHHLAALEWSRAIAGTALVLAAGILVRDNSVSRQVMVIALARFATMTCLVAPIYLHLLVRLAGLSYRQLLQSVTPSLMAALSTILVVRIASNLGGSKPIIALATQVFVGGFTGLSVLFFLDNRLREFAASFWGKMTRAVTV